MLQKEVSFNGEKEKVNNYKKISDLPKLIILNLVLNGPNTFPINRLDLFTCTKLILFWSCFHFDTITITSNGSFPLFCCESTSITKTVTKCHP